MIFFSIILPAPAAAGGPLLLYIQYYLSYDTVLYCESTDRLSLLYSSIYSTKLS